MNSRLEKSAFVLKYTCVLSGTVTEHATNSDPNIIPETLILREYVTWEYVTLAGERKPFCRRVSPRDAVALADEHTMCNLISVLTDHRSRHHRINGQTYLTHTRTVRPSEPEVGDRVPGAEQLVTDALHAFEAQDWLRLVELTDRDSIVTLRTQYDFRKNLQDSSLASMESYEPRSEVDQHIADYLASRHKFGELAGITTFEQVHALSDEEFLIRWAQARDHRYLVNGVTPWHEHPSTFPRAVVGSIALTPDTVAVLVRALGTFAPRALDNYSMIPVIGDRSERWHLDAGSGWFGLADAFF